MDQKIVPPSRLTPLIRRLKREGKKIVFTNGTFDILHLGHVTYLEKAKALGDVLIAGVNSDQSVKTYKSPDRPINPEGERMKVLSALSCVDYVVLFREPTPLELIKRIRPEVLVKGSDWAKNKMVGAREVEAWGGKVRRIPLVRGRSTSRILQLLQSAGQ